MELLTLLDGDHHTLLEPHWPSYSYTTVRRAFIVWLKCGQRNQFRDVCDYYHRLEALEETFSTNARAESRNHELSLYVEPPPTSNYQQKLFPQLYAPSQQDCQNFTPSHLTNYLPAKPMKNEEMKVVAKVTKVKETKDVVVSPQEIFDASQVFKVPAVETVNKKIAANFDIPVYKKTSSDILKEILKIPNITTDNSNKTDENLKGTSKQDIIETSLMIKKYCKKQQVSMKSFLKNFKEHATRCELNNTVNNVGFYIKRKMVQSELTTAVMVYKSKSCNGSQLPTSMSIIDSNLKEALNEQRKTGLLNIFTKLKNKGDKKDETDDITLKAIESTDKNVDNDSITLDDNANEQKDNITTLFKRQDDLKNDVGFSNSQNIVKQDILKCRKI